VPVGQEKGCSLRTVTINPQMLTGYGSARLLALTCTELVGQVNQGREP
jgi:hypothetical protein